jgi:hypothetical protein
MSRTELTSTATCRAGTGVEETTGELLNAAAVSRRDAPMDVKRR